MMIETGAHQVQANFVVHSDNLENLRAAFAKANKAGMFTMIEGNETFKYYGKVSGRYVELAADNSMVSASVGYTKIFISGTVAGIPGYEIIGRIDERDGPRMVFNFSDTDTGEHRTRSLYCAHCQTAHRRTSTFLFRNKNTRELFQVGNSCVEHYTGTSADITRALIRIFGIAEDFAVEPGSENEEFFSNSPRMYNVREVLALALAVAKYHGGYRRAGEGSGTGECVSFILNNPHEGEQFRDAAKTLHSDVDTIIETIMQIDPVSQGRFADYYFNLQSLIAGEYAPGKRINMVASMTAVYFRGQKKIEFKDEFFGEAGQKFTAVPVSVVRQSTHSTDFGPSQKVTLITSTGHKLVWWNKNCDVKDGETFTINFKVKGHDTYNRENKSCSIFYVKKV